MQANYSKGRCIINPQKCLPPFYFPSRPRPGNEHGQPDLQCLHYHWQWHLLHITIGNGTSCTIGTETGHHEQKQSKSTVNITFTRRDEVPLWPRQRDKTFSYRGHHPFMTCFTRVAGLACFACLRGPSNLCMERLLVGCGVVLTLPLLPQDPFIPWSYLS